MFFNKLENAVHIFFCYIKTNETLKGKKKSYLSQLISVSERASSVGAVEASVSIVSAFACVIVRPDPCYLQVQISGGWRWRK